MYFINNLFPVSAQAAWFSMQWFIRTSKPGIIIVKIVIQWTRQPCTYMDHNKRGLSFFTLYTEIHNLLYF